MNAFKDRPKRDQKAAENFAEGADVSTNTKNINPKNSEEESQTQEAFYTTLQPRFKKLIQAIAYYDRISQREVVEQALGEYYSDKKEHLEKAIIAYENQ